jgi:signal transduction histidine kinase
LPHAARETNLHGVATDDVDPAALPRLVLAVLIVTMLGFVGATFLAQRIGKIVNEDAISIATNAVPAIQSLTDARSELVRIAVAAASALSSAREDANGGAVMLAAALPALHADLQRYLEQPFYPREGERYAEVERATRVLEARASDFAAAVNAGDPRAAASVAKKGLLPAIGTVDDALSRVVLFNTQQQRRLALEIPRRRLHAYRVGYLLQCLTAIFGLALMTLAIRGLRAYAQLLARARAANRARDEVLATVSHDLRNPINAIALTVRSIRRASADATIEKLAARIERATERVNRLIEDLLDAARIEARVLRPDRGPEDAGKLADAAVEMFRPMADERAIRLEARLPAGGAIVLCERHLVMRVLSNILGNAVKFSPQGGVIVVTAEPLPGEVRFSIRDGGPGIPLEQRGHVFDRYWHEKKGNRRGTGLGLYIAKGIVEAHGGRIWIEDAGPGTIISFTLPLEPIP